MLTRKKILLITGAAAITVRGIFAWIFSTSLFRHYHLVPGLDMQTLLRFSEWGSGVRDSVPLLTPHRLMLFLNWFFHGNAHILTPIFVIQALLGAVACVAVADITLTLSGKRRGALAAGLIAALYLPSLVYEFSILQDSFVVNFTLLAVWGTLFAWRRHFNTSSAVLCAVLWSFALNGRPVAILCMAALAGWTAIRMYRKKQLKRLILPAALLLILLTAVSSFNRAYGWKFSPFYSPMQYTKTFNTAPGAAQATTLQVIMNAASRSPQLLSAYELRENHNIYFWQYKHPELRALPSSSELVPAACAALVILLIAGAWKRKNFYFIAIPLLTLALPLCARDVIGRYRLMLTPYFIIAVIMAFYAAKKLSRCRLTVALTAGAAAAVISIASASGKQLLFDMDFHAWAVAAEKSGAKKKTVYDLYHYYWRQSDFTSEKAFCKFAECTLEFRDPQETLNIIRRARQNRVSPDTVNYYDALVMLILNRPEITAQLCDRINPDRLPPHLRKKYFLIRRDAQQILLHKRKN